MGRVPRPSSDGRVQDAWRDASAPISQHPCVQAKTRVVESRTRAACCRNGPLLDAVGTSCLAGTFMNVIARIQKASRSR